MRYTTLLNLQLKYAGMWVATSQKGQKVHACGKKIKDVIKTLRKKKVDPKKTVIGFMEKKGHLNAHFSFPI